MKNSIAFEIIFIYLVMQIIFLCYSKYKLYKLIKKINSKTK